MSPFAWQSNKVIYPFLLYPKLSLGFDLGPRYKEGLPRWLNGKDSTANAGDAGSIPGSGRSPEEGNGNPLQYSSLENPLDQNKTKQTEPGGLQSMGPKESDMTEHAHTG